MLLYIFVTAYIAQIFALEENAIGERCLMTFRTSFTCSLLSLVIGCGTCPRSLTDAIDLGARLNFPIDCAVTFLALSMAHFFFGGGGGPVLS